jgi:hypothetical protein
MSVYWFSYIQHAVSTIQYLLNLFDNDAVINQHRPGVIRERVVQGHPQHANRPSSHPIHPQPVAIRHLLQ